MRYVVPYNNGNKPIPLGRAGENEYTEIAFDISAWQREFTINSINLLIQRPNDGEAYPADVTIEGVYAVHTLTSADLAYPGIGKCQLQMLSGTVIAKTRIYSTLCNCSLDANGSAPTPWYGSVWAQRENKGAILPYDMPGEGHIGDSTVLIGTDFPISALDDKTGQAFANLVVLPPMYDIAIQAAPAGSTSYTSTGTGWSNNYGDDVSFLMDFKYSAKESNIASGNDFFAYPTSVVKNLDGTVTFTFAESLNPNNAISSFELGVTLGAACRGGVSVGNGIYNNGSRSIAAGVVINNEGQNALVMGQNVRNAGNDSVVAGINNENTATRAVVMGSRILNTKRDAAIFGRGHNSTDAPEGVAAVGEFSDLGSATLFAVGNGTDEANRSNAMEVTTAGEILEGGTKLADKYQAKVIPDAPSADGNYVLKCAVSGGVPTYAWVAE